jgi:nicotinamidase-related amidase
MEPSQRAQKLAFDATNSLLLLIDVQERFEKAIPAISADQPCGKNCRLLLKAAALLHVPRLITEQYPSGLGATLPHLLEVAPEVTRFGKMHFSCVDDAVIFQALQRHQRPHVIICGIEAHVCVLTTVVDLLARGFNVTVAGDALASRQEQHVPFAINAMRDCGAVVVPTETIIMRWQRQAGIGCFKELAQLIR